MFVVCYTLPLILPPEVLNSGLELMISAVTITQGMFAFVQFSVIFS